MAINVNNSMAEKKRISDAQAELRRLQLGSLVDLMIVAVPSSVLTPMVAGLKAARDSEENRQKERRRAERASSSQNSV